MELIEGIVGLVVVVLWISVAVNIGRMNRCLQMTLAQQWTISAKANYTNKLLEVLVKSAGKPLPKVDPTQEEIMADMGITFNGKHYLINGEQFGARHEPRPRTAEEAIAMAKKRGMG